MFYQILGNIGLYFKELFYVIVPALLKSWPFIVLLICLMLKKPIIRLIDRLKTVKAPGIEMTTEQQPVTPENSVGREKVQSNKTQKNKQSTEDKEVYQTVPEGSYKRLLIDVVKNIEEEINSIPDDCREDYIIKDIATKTIVIEFNKIYDTIYDSQLRFLKFLSLNDVASEDVIKSFYDTAKNEYEEIYKNISFDVWLSFILNSYLITKYEKEFYCLTVRGGAFLDYIGALNLKKYKTL